MKSIRLQRGPSASWHLNRRRQILIEHPEVRSLLGNDIQSAWFIVLLVAVQLAVAIAVSRGPGWIALLLAYAVGTFVAHALGVLIHDCAHDVVFRRRWANRLIAIVANIPLVIPAAIDFQQKHLQHHRGLGQAHPLDKQCPRPWEAKFAGRSWWRKSLWLTFGPVLFHSPHPDLRAPRSWLLLNYAVQVGVTAAIAWAFGWWSILYLVFSALMAFGPHPVGIRRYAEHVILRNGQPTYSYYGPLNHISFQVGHHVEHHDFPGIPWRRLPRLRKIASNHYDDLARVDSWVLLLFRFLFDRRFTVDRYPKPEGFVVPLSETTIRVSGSQVHEHHQMAN